MAKTTVDNIPATGKARTEAEDAARKKIVRRYERFVRDKMGQINNNAGAYVNKRTHSKSGVSIELRKVLKSATFVAAHPTRFQAGGYAVEDTKYFVLHRPGRQIKAAWFDNIIREFTQPNRKASTHFIISQAGALVQMVDLGDIAYHCGDSSPATNVNSVGVELEGAVGQPMSSAMLDSLANLIATVAAISGMDITEETVLNHSTILPNEKIDAWITRRIHGRIEDSKLRQILNMANTAYTKFASGSRDFYKPPFDPREDAATKVGEIMALAAAPGTSYLEMARLQSAAASQAALGRTMMFGSIDRTAVGMNSAMHAAGLMEQMGSSLADFIRDNNIRVDPTPQENNAGVLLDQETGLVNDGDPL